MALLVQQKALHPIGRMRPLIVAIHKRDRSMADQLRRSSSSVVLNIAEADGSDAGNARARFATACGSAKEARITLKLATAWGYIHSSSAEEIESALDEVCAMTWRLSGR